MSKSTMGVEDIAFISTNENGDFHIGFKVEVPRGIHAKGKTTADELFIWGIPKKQLRHALESLLKEGITCDQKN